MSRLADRLAGMDRGARRPSGLGGIPGLGGQAVPRRKWRGAVPLAMLLLMAALAVTFLLRSQGPVLAPAPATPQVPAAMQGVGLASPPAPAASPSPAHALLVRADEAARRGALAEAASLFRQALAADREEPEAWNGLGVMLVRQGEVARGADAFRRAVALAPEHAEARRNLAVALDRLGRPGEAEPHYREFLRLAAPGHPAREDVRRRLLELRLAGRAS